MSISWFVYSTKTLQEAESVLEQCDEAIGDYFDAHVDQDEQFGFMEPSGKIPALEEIEKACKKFKKVLDPRVKKLHPRCRSVVQIENPGPLEMNRLQVSLLRYLLERMDDCLFDWGDGLVEPGASVLKSLHKYEMLADFPPEQPLPVEADDDDDDSIEDQAVQEGFTETVAILECFERLCNISRLDLKRCFDKLPDKQQAYLQLIVEGGPISHSKAARELAVPKDQLVNLCEQVAGQLGALLRQLGTE